MGDRWFTFDGVLVFLAVFETWFVTIFLWVYRGNESDRQTESDPKVPTFLKESSTLRILRLMRLVRIARIYKLLRSAPEIMVVIRALSSAVRTVMVTLFLMGFIVYVFAISLTQLSKDTELEATYFRSVPDAMHSLLVAAAMPDLETMMKSVLDVGFFYWLLLLIFMACASIAIMNLMIGVLVEIVKVTSDAERESMDICMLRDHLLECLASLKEDFDKSEPDSVIITKEDFCYTLENWAVLEALQSIGIDVFGLCDLIEFIFVEEDELPFPEVMDVVLQLRSRNFATVKDLVDLRKYLKHEIDMVTQNTTIAINGINKIMDVQMKQTATQGELPSRTAITFLHSADHQLV